MYIDISYTAPGTPKAAAAALNVASCVPVLVPSFVPSFLRSFVRSADDRDLRIKFDNTKTKPIPIPKNTQKPLTKPNINIYILFKHNYLMYLYLCELI